ncbi:methyltransferase family protein [Kribbella sp. VKM Ac-2527]|uniref:Methyltransferase family protein n=1 Tax=Kribbella caucasensis TaxID=2512215 RepID=A0A4R6IYM5_9ACTN|nr:class I SAM-dependent methyltransferase [Kribbella sp. VKM Ac-2527]TDO27949.1 methyltransferase family protein [Kribbella sp. VKM Ac-2527]
MSQTETEPQVVHEIHDHYTNRHDEAHRLSSTLKGQLELQRVQELLTRHLPPAPADVADVGGGPGIHASWLASLGYNVEVLDPVHHHVDQAREAGLTAIVGDARRLPWANESKDAVLLAGPMYHLKEAADRRVAIREAIRVLRPGGVLAVIAINRAANLIGATLANRLQRRRLIVEDILNDGYSPDNERMAHTVYHTVAQLRSELSQFVSQVQIHGLTGPGGWLTVLIDAHYRDAPMPDSLLNPDPLQTALACTRLADRQPDLVHASSLLFAVGRRA